MAFPTATVEIAFTTDPLDAAPAWTTVSTLNPVRSWEIDRGRQHELNRVEPGRMTLVLDNRNRYLDPRNDASPYYGGILPMRRIRVTVVHGATTYRRFTGYVRSWRQIYAKGNQDASVVLECVDALALLALYPANTYQSMVLEDGPVGLWMLDETSGTTATDLGSGANNGTYAGSPGLGDAGPLYGGQTATDFDEVDDWVSIGSPAELLITGDITVGAWVKNEENTGGASHILLSAYPTWQLGFYRSNAVTNKQIYFQEAIGTTQAENVLWDDVDGSELTFDDGKYHFVAARRKGSEVTLFFDDALTFDGVIAITPSTATSAVFLAALLANDTLLNGDLYGAFVFNKAVPISRIQAYARARLGVFEEQLSGTAINALLDAFGWPAADRDIDAGSSLLQRFEPSGSYLDVLQQIAETEGGILYVDREGVIGFHDRHSLSLGGHLVPSSTFGDDGTSGEIGYGELEPLRDDTDLYTTVRMAREGGQTQEAVDLAAEAIYGPRTLERTGLLFADDLEAADAANYFLTRYREAGDRFPTLSFLLGGDSPDAAWAQALARDVHHDRIQIKRHPPGSGAPIDVEAHIEGARESVDWQSLTWETTWALVPSDQFAYWVLGDSELGVLGSTTRLGW